MIQFEVYKRTHWELQVNRRNTEIILVYLLELSIDAHTKGRITRHVCVKGNIWYLLGLLSYKFPENIT